ncbi:MAG: DUF4115 domain-containing protein [Candidatus Omnitrophica bacterium]|nr:DUF4115 domain-containing protein [Candidatus Omnitrophota bacterium]
MTESLGKTLKKFRETRQLSIEDVAERTRIPKNIISTIEEDSILKTTAPFYARGFIKSYSQFLGALEERIVKEFLSSGEKRPGPQLAPKPEKPKGEWFLKHKRQIGLVFVAFFSVYLLAFGFVQVGRFIRNLFTKHKEQAAAATSEVASTATSEVAEGFTVELTARYNTWIQVTKGKELLFRGILKKGDSDTWEAKTRIDMEIGNAGGVTLRFNGKDLGTPGKKGEKKTLTITKEGII